MNNEVIHIVGAGIGGLTLALGLLRGGRRVRVYEQAPMLGEIGAGLSITPNASLGLAYLEMLDFMDAESSLPQTNYVFHGETNEQLVDIDRRQDMANFSAKYYQIHRADFHTELVRRIKQLDPDCIELNRKLVDVSETQNTLTLEFAEGASVEAETLIGADGIKSATRDQVFRDCEPEFTGVMAWRGLISADQVSASFIDSVSRVWSGPGRTFVTYPVRKGALVNVVAFGQASDWVEESWAVPAQLEELKSTFEGFCAPVQELIRAVPTDNLFRWGLFARKPLETLVRGRVALIGDAAHPMLPWFGQGASSSIEDGVVLARCFIDSPDTTAALERYNTARFERVHFLQTESNLGTERMQGFDPYLLRDAPRRDEDALGIFRYNAATVAI